MNRETQNIKNIQQDLLAEKEFLTITETCQMLSVSRWTIWRAIKNDTLKAGKIGARTLIKKCDIENIFKSVAHEEIKKDNVAPRGQYDIKECYSTEQVRNKYGISESALRNIIIKNKVPKFRKGWFAYVPIEIIDKLFSFK